MMASTPLARATLRCSMFLDQCSMFVDAENVDRFACAAAIGNYLRAVTTELYLPFRLPFLPGLCHLFLPHNQKRTL